MQLATRLSVNMEAPSAAHLARIAPGKNFDSEILAPMRQVSRAIADGRFARAGQTTQLVVGAAGEADREVARAAAWAYRELKLARVYYSALQPVPGTPVADRPPVAFGREHRLYQVDFLLRSYGFSIDEIEFDAGGALSLDVDPKTAWARRHPERFPVEINTAARGDSAARPRRRAARRRAPGEHAPATSPARHCSLARSRRVLEGGRALRASRRQARRATDEFVAMMEGATCGLPFRFSRM